MKMPEILEEAEFNSIVSQLSNENIEKKVRHPASREGTIINSVQSFLAAKKTPDHDALKSYAKACRFE